MKWHRKLGATTGCVTQAAESSPIPTQVSRIKDVVQSSSTV
jgi:hypothetical protein